MSSPLHAQYTRIKDQFPHTIVYFRLGDFYEMFDEDARIGARELELTLTTREFTRGDRAPMCGAPYHAVETHVARLVSRGYTVAICEQIGDPRTSSGLAQREVVRVVNPSSMLARGRGSAPDRPPGDGEVMPAINGEGVAEVHVAGTSPAVAAGRTKPRPATAGPQVDVSPMEVRPPASSPVVQLALFAEIDEHEPH